MRGTHVKRTGQIGVLLVRRCTKVRQDWRVEFVCGGRAERLARHDFQLLRETAEKLGCAPEDVLSVATRAITERDTNFKNLRAMAQRLAEIEATVAVQAIPIGANGLRIVSRILADDPAEFIGFLAAELARTEKDSCASCPPRMRPCFLSRSILRLGKICLRYSRKSWRKSGAKAEARKISHEAA